MVEYRSGGKRSWAQCVLWCAVLALANAFGGCAVEDTSPTGIRSGTSGAAAAGTSGIGGALAGASGVAGTSAGQGGDLATGGASGGAGSSGASNGGTAGIAHGGTGGSAVGGSAPGGTGSGGSSGSAGSAGHAAGGVSGGSAGQAGSGGSAGTAGTGGSGTVHCSDHPIPSKTSWTVTASSADAGSPLVNATDGNLATRWSTGVSQNNDWLQVDFGVQTALDSVTLQLGSSAGDYPRAYEVRVSNSPQNTAVLPLATGNGQQATDTVVTLTPPAVGRYLLISQVGSINGTWWSVAELTLACTH